jgi:transposase InsO family protein
MAGECWDNAVAESFFATIKRELIDTRAWPTRVGLRAAIFDYIEGWYNTRRLHSSLDYMSPGVCGSTLTPGSTVSSGEVRRRRRSSPPSRWRAARVSTPRDHCPPIPPSTERGGATST